jgi:hypothetical protein
VFAIQCTIFKLKIQEISVSGIRHYPCYHLLKHNLTFGCSRSLSINHTHNAPAIRCNNLVHLPNSFRTNFFPDNFGCSRPLFINLIHIAPAICCNNLFQLLNSFSSNFFSDKIISPEHVKETTCCSCFQPEFMCTKLRYPKFGLCKHASAFSSQLRKCRRSRI